MDRSFLALAPDVVASSSAGGLSSVLSVVSSEVFVKSNVILAPAQHRVNGLLKAIQEIQYFVLTNRGLNDIRHIFVTSLEVALEFLL